MPPEIQRLVDTFLKDPVRIEVTRPATAATTIKQLFRYCPSTEDWAKREMLRELIRSQDVKNAIIFCNRKRDVAILLKSLLKHGFNAGALHGDMDQMSRMATLDAFREGRITLLAASDVAARGLDIPDVSHIFNFDVPWQSDDYVHRIGRTGRAGKEGVSLTLVTPEDTGRLSDIERMLGAPVTWLGHPPSLEDMESGKRRRGRGRGGRGGRPSAGRGHHDARRGERPQRNGAHAGNGAQPHPEAANGAAQPNGDGRHEHAPPARAKTREPRQPRERAPREARQPRERNEHREARQPREGGEARQPRHRGEPREARPERHDSSDRGRSQEPQAGRQRKPARQPWEPRPPRQPRRGDESPGPQAVGMGDHVPAFMRKAVPKGQ
jgi:superfamily II DNA/RNA helicase